jgi:hypothetical protein
MKKFINAFNKAVTHNQNNDKKRSFNITYKKGNGRTVKRKIDPTNIRNGMVIAFDHKRKAIRSFKIERMKAMEKAAFWEGFTKKGNAKILDFGKKVKNLSSQIKHMEGLQLRLAENLAKKGVPQSKALDKAMQIDNISELYRKLNMKDPGVKPLAKSFASGGTGMIELKKAANIKNIASKTKGLINKHKDNLYHGAELAGLGILAAPSIQGLRGKHMSEKTKDKMELAGLGTLAAPSAAHLARKVLRRGR